MVRVALVFAGLSLLWIVGGGLLWTAIGLAFMSPVLLPFIEQVFDYHGAPDMAPVQNSAR